jgi:AcrR family transcriptional regulator
LYLAVLLEALQQTQTRIVRLVERRENVLHRLRLVARMLPSTWKDAGQMFHDIDHELDAQGRNIMSEAFLQRVVEPIASLFREGIAQGMLRDAEHGGLEPTEAVFVLFRLLNEQGTSEARSSIQNTDHMLDILLHGIAQSPLVEN